MVFITTLLSSQGSFQPVCSAACIHSEEDSYTYRGKQGQGQAAGEAWPRGLSNRVSGWDIAKTKISKFLI